jgi:isopentenyl diphosphate isomerase/L-lactate dehydrogenase-like FMN-dependent dehydrogenase
VKPVNIWDYERLAEEKLDPGAAAYYFGGAGDEVTLRDNVAAFERRKLRPRVLVDVASVTTKTTVLGTEIALPVVIAPLAMQRMAHPYGEEATARAAAAAGTIICLSSAATCPPAALTEGHRWFQVYVWRDRAKTLAAIEQAVASGYSALVLTVDVPYHGGRQLDGVPATLDVLEEIVDAVQGRAEVLLDGGVRRGVDVLKALALGARAVLIGRAMLWGLAVAGEEGVADVLRMFRDEIELGLALLGCASPADVSRAHVR